MSSPFDAAVAAIDAANAEDPFTLVVDGHEQPKELVHADVVERWVRHLDPGADDAQLLAARAHHLRRWVAPRNEYPDGRAGYLRWRRDQKRRQRDEVRELLSTAGCDTSTIERVGALVAKEPGGDTVAAQVHEDALCLTFLELQLEELADELGDDRVIEVLRKTTIKMSAAGLSAVAMVLMTPRAQVLVAAAVDADS